MTSITVEELNRIIISMTIVIDIVFMGLSPVFGLAVTFLSLITLTAYLLRYFADDYLELDEDLHFFQPGFWLALLISIIWLLTAYGFRVGRAYRLVLLLTLAGVVIVEGKVFFDLFRNDDFDDELALNMLDLVAGLLVSKVSWVILRLAWPVFLKVHGIFSDKPKVGSMTSRITASVLVNKPEACWLLCLLIIAVGLIGTLISYYKYNAGFGSTEVTLFGDPEALKNSEIKFNAGFSTTPTTKAIDHGISSITSTYHDPKPERKAKPTVPDNEDLVAGLQRHEEREKEVVDEPVDNKPVEDQTPSWLAKTMPGFGDVENQAPNIDQISYGGMATSNSRWISMSKIHRHAKRYREQSEIYSFNEEAGLKGRPKAFRVWLLKKYDYRCQICGKHVDQRGVKLHIDFKNLEMAKKYQRLNAYHPNRIPEDALTVVCQSHRAPYFAVQKMLYKKNYREFAQVQRSLASRKYLRDYITELTGEDGIKKCSYCGRTEYDTNPDGTYLKFQLDHKTPVAKGGLTRVDNLQWLCQNCNSSKSDVKI